MVLLDSNVWVAYLHETDSLHTKAAAILDEIVATGELVVLPEYVLSEVISVVRLRVGTEAAKEFVLRVLDSEWVCILERTKREYLTTCMMIVAGDYPKLSFVDCMLCILASKYHVVTFDKELQKAIG